MSSVEGSADEFEGFVGRELDRRYLLERFLDRGGFGAVYRGIDRKFNHPVAIKVGFSFREFMKEAKLAAEVRHDNIVRVSDYGCDNGLAYMVMELLEGDDLEKMFHRQGNRLAPGQLQQFVHEIGGALLHAHAHHLIHRDLKPRNIIFQRTEDDGNDSGGRFVLLDFGIAAKLDVLGTQRNRTQDGAGTICYMAPEMLRPDPTATPAADIYAFGVLLFQLLTGRLPYVQRDTSHVAMAECMNSILNAAPPSFAQVAADRAIPPEVEHLVVECLAKDPANRPSTMKEVRKRFAAAFAARTPPRSAAGQSAVDQTLYLRTIGQPDGAAWERDEPRAPSPSRSGLRLPTPIQETGNRGADTSVPHDTSSGPHQAPTASLPTSRGSHDLTKSKAKVDDLSEELTAQGAAPSAKTAKAQSRIWRHAVVLGLVIAFGATAMLSGLFPTPWRTHDDLVRQLSGTLAPPDSQLAVNGISVEVRDGRWTWRGSETVPLELKATRTGYADWTHTLATTDQPPLDIRMEPIAAISLDGTLDPPDARLTANGIEVEVRDGRWTWSSREPAAIELIASHAGYVDWKQSLSKESRATIPIRLEPVPVMSLSGTIDPPDSRLTINSTDVEVRDGRWTWTSMKAQTVELVARRDGFLEQKETLSSIGKTDIPIRLKPIPAMSLAGTLIPPDATLTINGLSVEVRDGQWKWNTLKAGTVEVVASRTGYSDWKQTVSKAGSMTLPIRLEPVPAMQLDGTLEPADAQLTINGTPVEVRGGRWVWSSREVQITEISATRSGYLDWKQKVSKAGRATLPIQLEPVPAIRLEGTLDPPDSRLTINGAVIDARDGRWTWISREAKPVELAARRSGYADWKQTLSKSGQFKIPIALNTAISIDPPNCKVTVDGRPVAVRTGTIEIPLTAGAEARVTLSEGDRSQDFTLTRKDLDLLRYRLVLTTPSPDAMRVSTPPEPLLAPFSATAAKTAQAAWAKFAGIPAVEANSAGIEFVVVPPGRFHIGDIEGSGLAANALAQQEVAIERPFRLSVTEVTQAQWTRVMATSPWRAHEIEDQETLPASYISREDAREFCRRLSDLENAKGPGGGKDLYRLPTEQEWEWACRAGTTGRVACEEKDIRQYAWYTVTVGNDGGARPVRKLKPNHFDLYDMHGNVAEWCDDIFGAAPLDAATSQKGILRGGSFNRALRHIGSAARDSFRHDSATADSGFRIVRTLSLPGPSSTRKIQE